MFPLWERGQAHSARPLEMLPGSWAPFLKEFQNTSKARTEYFPFLSMNNKRSFVFLVIPSTLKHGTDPCVIYTAVSVDMKQSLQIPSAAVRHSLGFTSGS